MLLLSPLTISLGIIAVIFASILYGLDKRRTSHQKHLSTLMRTFVAQNAMRSFSIVVRSNTSTQSIRRLLDSLEDQKYPYLEIIIIVDSGADKSTLNALRRLQRLKRDALKIRIVREKASGTERALIRRYIHGEALMWLTPDARLTNDFFMRMSFELLDEARSAITPRLTLLTNDTLLTATRALNLIASQTVGTLFNRKPADPLVIRRAAYLGGEPVKSIGVEHSAVILRELPTARAGVGIEVAVIISVLLTALLSAIFLPYGWQIVPVVFAGTVILLMALRLLAYPYSVWTKLSLTLLIPLWPVAAIIFAGAHYIRQAGKWLWNRRGQPIRQE